MPVSSPPEQVVHHSAGARHDLTVNPGERVLRLGLRYVHEGIEVLQHQVALAVEDGGPFRNEPLGPVVLCHASVAQRSRLG
jgi:hypothetical protein